MFFFFENNFELANRTSKTLFFYLQVDLYPGWRRKASVFFESLCAKANVTVKFVKKKKLVIN